LRQLYEEPTDEERVITGLKEIIEELNITKEMQAKAINQMIKLRFELEGHKVPLTPSTEGHESLNEDFTMEKAIGLTHENDSFKSDDDFRSGELN
jgi:hypothetical protein